MPGDRVVTGLYGFDDARYIPLWDQRRARAGGWPQRFLYVGRYVRAVKGLDLLVNAYRQYRAGVDRPWPLVCCGAGPEHIRAARGLLDEME